MIEATSRTVNHQSENQANAEQHLIPRYGVQLDWCRTSTLLFERVNILPNWERHESVSALVMRWSNSCKCFKGSVSPYLPCLRNWQILKFLEKKIPFSEWSKAEFMDHLGGVVHKCWLPPRSQRWSTCLIPFDRWDDLPSGFGSRRLGTDFLPKTGLKVVSKYFMNLG